MGRRGPGRGAPTGGRGGFTLVEVLMALLLLMVVAPALLGLGVRVMTGMHATSLQWELLAAASQVADSLRLHGEGGGGSVRHAGGWIRWSREEDEVTVEALLDPGPGRNGQEGTVFLQLSLPAAFSIPSMLPEVR